MTSAANSRKKFALLVDPDRYDSNSLSHTIREAGKAMVDYIFVGGSLLNSGLDTPIRIIRDNCQIPVIIFPGSILQVSSLADAILLLMLISGRNPDLLIGNHVLASGALRSSGLETISTGYMIIGNGKTSSVEYMSNTKPIPSDKNDIAVATAIAGEMIGNRLIYLEAGSGAARPVSSSMIRAVKDNISVPLIVGGGIRTGEAVREICDAGADILVIGNAVENDTSFIFKASEIIHS